MTNIQSSSPMLPDATATSVIDVRKKEIRKKLIWGIIVVCIVVVLISAASFAKNMEHDGVANFIMASMSYITTSVALALALYYL